MYRIFITWSNLLLTLNLLIIPWSQGCKCAEGRYSIVIFVRCVVSYKAWVGVLSTEEEFTTLISHFDIKFLEILVPNQHLHPTFSIPVIINWKWFFINIFKNSGIFINKGHNFLLPVALQVNKTVTRSLTVLYPVTWPLDIVWLGRIFQKRPSSSQLIL